MAAKDALAALLVLLLLAQLLCQAQASVILQTGENFTYDAIADIPADFGPRVPPEGVGGLLMVAEPEDACTPVQVPVVGQPWVALVVRSQEKLKNCTFDVKVSYVEAAGAVACIVYDDVLEPLIIMSKPLDHPDPGIPSVFVSQRSGVMMKRLMIPGVTTVEITPISDAIWLSMLMSAFAGFLAMSVVLGTFFFIRHQRLGLGGMGGGGGAGGYGAARPAPRTMSPEQIRALPVEIYEGPQAHHRRCAAARGSSGGGGEGSTAEGGTRLLAGTPLHYRPEPVAAAGGEAEPGAADSETSGSDEDAVHPGHKGGGTRHTCAICLENYVEGDKLRVLPCQHRYHAECIDQWLSSRKPLCPACRHDATERDVEAGSPAGDGTRASPARRVWAALGGRWLLLRLGGQRALRAARHDAGAGEAEEAQRLIPPGPPTPAVSGGAGPSYAPPQLRQRQEGAHQQLRHQQQQQEEGAWEEEEGQQGQRLQPAPVRGRRFNVATPAAAGGSGGSGSSSRALAAQGEPEIVPEPAAAERTTGSIPNLVPQRPSPRRLQPGAVAAAPGSPAAARAQGAEAHAGASSRTSGARGGSQASAAVPAVWVVESQADSSTEGSEGL